MGARCACCRTQEHTFQKVLGELVHTAAEEEVGKEKNSFDLEGKMYCNDRHMAWKQVGGRTLEHYWTSQSEEHREPHQLVPLEVVGSIPSVGTVGLQRVSESLDLENTVCFQNAEDILVL